VDWEFSKGWHFNLTGRVERSTVEAKSRSLEYPGDAELNFSRENDEWNQALQAGVRWEAEMGISSWLRYDRLYRLPSTDEIASYQGYPLSVPFNDRLEAEKGHNLELGTEYAKGAWDFRVNGFAQSLEGEIAYDYLRNLNVNFADTRRVGVEFEAGYHSDFWDAKVNYTWLKAEFDDGQYAGKDVYLVPRQEFGATLGFHPVKNVTIQGEYQYTGDSFEGNDFENEQEKLPAYGVANLLVRYEPKPGLSVYARINNLTDERYATVKYSGVWYPAAGRQVMVGVRSEF
jgi:outer membrane receptor protein involved in Fe transport